MAGYGEATYGVTPWGDFYQLGASRLLYMLRMSPHWRSIADIIDGRYVAIQDVIERIRLAFNPDDAEGEQLDIIGAWIGRPRDGMLDDRYRRALRVQVFLLSSNNGSGPNLIEVFRAWTGALPTSYRNVAPIYVELEGAVEPEDEYLLDIFIRAALPAGVPYALFITNTNALIVDSVADPVTDPGVVDSVADPVPDARPIGFALG